MPHEIGNRGRIGRARYQTILDMIEDGSTAREIANHLGVFPETVRKFARRRRLTIASVDQAGANHPSWKGGLTIDKQGYEMVRVDRAGPYGYLVRQARRNDPRGYALRHRVVMHDKLGRPLLPGEVVHHRDGDTRNNHPDNLEVFRCNGDHLRETLKGRRPSWSPEGKARMTGRPPKRRSDHLDESCRPPASIDHPKSDDRM